MDAKIWRRAWWIARSDSRFLQHKTKEMLKLAGFEIVRDASHEFKPFGWTAFYLLAESHLAIHAWPENGRVYMDLVSCNESMFRAFCGILEIEFEAVLVNG